MATQDISQLVVEVKSQGIQTAANQLDKLTTAAGKAETAVKKLGTVVVTSQQTTATSQAQAAASSVSAATDAARKSLTIAQRREVEMYNIRSAAEARLRSLQEKRDTEEWASAQAQAKAMVEIQQKRDIEIYESRVSEAAKLKAIQEKRDLEEWEAAQTQAQKIKAIQEKRDIEIYEERVATAAKLKAIQEKRDMEEYAAAREEAARMVAIEQKRDMEIYEARVAANARLMAEEEKQRRMNAAFQTASIASQIRTAREAQAYAALGGDATTRFGSAAATADIAALTAEQKRLAAATRAAATAQTEQNVVLAETHALARGLSGSLGALWVTYGNLAGMALGIAIGASLKGVISTGKDVEQTLEQIRVLGQASMDDIAKMGTAITELGKGTQGPKEVAEALQVLTLAGLNAKDALSGVQAALNLSVAGGIGIEKSAETLVQVSTALGYTAQGFDHVADVIAKTAAVSMSSVDSISNAFKSAAAVGEVYGATLQDIALGLAAIANLGIQGTSAGTALKNFYKDLSASTQKVSTTLQAMHLSIADFRDSEGYFLPLIDVVKKLDSGFNTLSNDQKKLAEVKMFSQQGAREYAVLTKLLHTASEEVDAFGNKYASKLDEMQADIKNAAAFSTTAAIAMAQTTSNQFKSVGNTIQSQFADAFKAVQPQLISIAQHLKDAFASPAFQQALKDTTSFLLTMASALGNNIELIRDFVVGWTAYKALDAAGIMLTAAAGTKTLSEALVVATSTMKGFWVTLGPIGIAIAGLTTLWAMYRNEKEKALNNDSSARSIDEYIAGLRKAAQNELEIAGMREKGATAADVARKRQMQADKDASDAVFKASEAEIEKMKEALKDKWSDLGVVGKHLVESALASGKDIKQIDAPLGINTSALTKVEQYITLAQKVRDAEKKLADQRADSAAENGILQVARDTNAHADDAAAASRVLSTGDGKLPEKADTKALNDKYNAAIKSFQDDIKAANQALENFREEENAKFKAGKIGQVQMLEEIADKEISTYKRIQAAAKGAEAVADNTPDKTADAERFHSEAERAKVDAAQADKMRTANRLAAERAALAQETSLKVKALEAQGKYVDAANLKWSSDGKLALEQAEADLDKYGDKFPWLEKLVNQYKETRDSAINSAKLKEDALAFDTSILELESTLKGFKAATFGTSIDTMFESATKATETFNDALENAKAKRTKLLEDAMISDSPEAWKKYEEANKQILAIGDKQKTMWQEVGQTITDSLTKAFGTAGTAMGEMYKASIKLSQSENMNTSDRIAAYGNMAQAASGFFDKQSKGYRMLNGIAQVFHVAEMARTLVRTAASVAAGAAKFFEQSGWGGFAGVAAMGAVMAGLGYAMAGSGADNSLNAEEVQKKQGTGTVFGDAQAKSDSIKKSMDDLKSNSDMMLPLTQAMLNSLKNIEASMSGLANLVIRQGANDGSNFGIQQGVLSKGFLGNGVIGNIVNSSLGWIVSPVLKLLNNLWGKTTQTLVDSGLTFGGRVSDLQSGQGFNQYATVKTDSSSWFGLVKNSSTSVQTQGVSEELSRQFGLVFSNLEDVLKGAATTLGTDSDTVGKAIDNIVLQTTKISLKDLSGDALTSAINNVISGAMDEIARQVYPQMQDFQQVGEGYAQTVVRVASAVEQADTALAKLGVQAINYTDIANKTGDVAYEIAKQSILANETVYGQLSGVGEIMKTLSGTIDDVVSAYSGLVSVRKEMLSLGLGDGLNFDTLKGAGDLKSLTSDLTTYYDKYFGAQEKIDIQTKKLTEQFNALGYSLPSERGELRKWIEEAAKTGDQLKIGQLLALAGGFDELETAIENLDKTVTAAKGPFDDDAVKAAKAAYDDALNLAESAYNKLEASINAEKTKIQRAKDALQTTVDGVKDILNSLADAIKATSPKVSDAQSFADAMGIITSAISVINGGGDISKVSGLKDAFKTVSEHTSDSYSTLLEYQRAQAKANAALKQLNDAGQNQLSVAEKQLELYQKQLDGLDMQLEIARDQLDSLKGIDNGVTTVAAAFANFQTMLLSALAAKSTYDAVSAGNTGNGASDAIESLYKNILGRSSDAAGKAYWMAAFNAGTSMSDITKYFLSSQEYLNSPSSPSSKTIDTLYKSILGRTPDEAGKAFWMDKLNSGISITDITAAMKNSNEYQHPLFPSFDVGTNNVPENMLAMVHKGERIIPAADNAELQRRLDDTANGEASKTSNDELKEAIKDLIQAVQIGDVANVQKTSDLFKVVQRWETDGMPPVRETEPS
jgi:TP901 family phage tail tape measure protein